jgi:uncharacterized protein (TIGR01319 family)
MGLGLFIDFGSTYTKATVVDLVNEEILAAAQAHTTVETSIMEGLEKALEPVYRDLGRNINFKHKVACSSAAGGLKMVALGLVKDLTVEAAKRAALGAGARVLDVFSYELSGQELERIDLLQPDIILLAGGTDGGNKEVLLANAKKLGKLKRRMSVVVAGNKTVAEEAAELLSSFGFETWVTANVMPELNQLNIEPARLKIREIFVRRIIEAKGLKEAEAFIDDIMMPTPAAVLNAAKLLAKGTAREAGWGDLVVIDPGGATTDVHSVATGAPTKAGVTWKGLPEPEVKRTVEGDLGMRYNARTLWEAGQDLFRALPPKRQEDLKEYAAAMETRPASIPVGKADLELDKQLGCAAIAIAMERHAGNLEVLYTPFGQSFLQYGKDLTEVKHVIGTGGVLVNNPQASEMLEKALFEPEKPQSLRPRRPNFWLDRSYILATMGLMAELDADKSLRMLKKYLVRLGRGQGATAK